MAPINRFSIATMGSCLCILCATLLATLYLPKTSIFPRTAYGAILHEETSAFSKIRVRGSDTKRHLLFVSDSGREGLQSSIDLSNPGELQVAYSKALYASLLFQHPTEKVLIVGLGGGGMVRFMEHNFPETEVEAVEIDPSVVALADKYFETREKPGITIHTEDAFTFIKRGESHYDAIYMDAFLRPSVDRDANRETARLKTVSFLQTVKDRLSPDGVLACNLIAHRKATRTDLDALREVFPTVKTIRVPGTGNLVALAGKTKIEHTKEEWLAIGKALEGKLSVGIPFAVFAERMR